MSKELQRREIFCVHFDREILPKEYSFKWFDHFSGDDDGNGVTAHRLIEPSTPTSDTTWSKSDKSISEIDLFLVPCKQTREVEVNTIFPSENSQGNSGARGAGPVRSNLTTEMGQIWTRKGE
jgi:hypothetical protein